MQIPDTHDVPDKYRVAEKSVHCQNVPDISQGSVVTHRRCGGILNDVYITSLPIKSHTRNSESQ